MANGRPSPAARAGKRQPMAHVGGYSAPVDTTGLDPEMKETMQTQTPFQKRMGKLGDLVRKVIKPKGK